MPLHEGGRDANLTLPDAVHPSRFPPCALVLVALLGAACVRPAQRVDPIPPRAVAWPERPALETEGRAIAEGYRIALGTLDRYLRYRQQAAGLPAALTCPAPTGSAWARTSTDVEALRERGNLLFRRVQTASVDEALWREQRTLAVTARVLAGLGDDVAWARTEIDLIDPQGNGGRAVQPLDRAWSTWQETAARLGAAPAPRPGGCT